MFLECNYKRAEPKYPNLISDPPPHTAPMLSPHIFRWGFYSVTIHWLYCVLSFHTRVAAMFLVFFTGARWWTEPCCIFQIGALVFQQKWSGFGCPSAVSMVAHNQFMLFRTASHNVHVVIADVSSFFAAP